MKTKKAVEIYGLIGKALLSCAGGIVGFILGGPIAAVLGIFLGTIVGYLFEKGIVYTSS